MRFTPSSRSRRTSPAWRSAPCCYGIPTAAGPRPCCRLPAAASTNSLDIVERQRKNCRTLDDLKANSRRFASVQSRSASYSLVCPRRCRGALFHIKQRRGETLSWKNVKFHRRHCALPLSVGQLTFPIDRSTCLGVVAHCC